MPEARFQKSFVLTVSESKRLIARCIKRHPAVLKALSHGTVAVAKGSTNSYIVEELTGEGICKPHYCTGTTRPRGGSPDSDIANKLPDLVLERGERVEDVSATEAIKEMKAGDVFMKGANALNYERKQAGVLVGHPTGGTLGAAIGTVVARRICLMIPVGLEKSVPADLAKLYYRLTEVGEHGHGPTLWPLEGEIFTEIEALRHMCGVEACPIGAGGIAGAEGSIRISVWGHEGGIKQVGELLDSISGEPPFAG